VKKSIIWLAGICLGVYLLLTIYREYKIRSRDNFINTFYICNNLKVEKFKVFSSSDLYCDYLTDSSKFRLLIGTYQDDEDILYKCKADTIFIDKVNMADTTKIIRSWIYNLSSLKRKSNYK
jgi:hypothetical protein